MHGSSLCFGSKLTSARLALFCSVEMTMIAVTSSVDQYGTNTRSKRQRVHAMHISYHCVHLNSKRHRQLLSWAFAVLGYADQLAMCVRQSTVIRTNICSYAGKPLVYCVRSQELRSHEMRLYQRNATIWPHMRPIFSHLVRTGSKKAFFARIIPYPISQAVLL